MSHHLADNQFNTMAKSLDNLYKDFDLPEELVDDYRVLSCLADATDKGVYLLEDLKSRDRYILKVGSGRYKDLLQNEYKILTVLKGDFMPKAVFCMSKDGKTFLVREYVEGDTLEQMLDKNGECSISQAIDIMLDICQGIEKMHCENPPVIHRDIKPQNIILTKTGKCKFIDMDTTREYKPDEEYDTIFMGTKKTAAPEQFGYGQTSVRTDIYGLGILFLYLLTGQYSIKCKEWKNLPFSVRRVISKCTAFAPDDRYIDVGKLISKLKHLKKKAVGLRYKVTVVSVIIILSVGLGFCVKYAVDTNDSKKDVTNKEIKFEEPRIEEAVRYMLGKEEDEPIYQEELDRVRTIIICGDKIFRSWDEHREYHGDYYTEISEEPLQTEPLDLTDLEKMPNLTTLALDNQGLVNVSELEKLNLSKLSLQRNQIIDLTGISDNTNLSELFLSFNPIDTLEGIEGIENLRILEISNTQVYDLSPLEKMPLTELSCMELKLESLSVVDSLDKLQSLYLSYLSTEDIVYLNSLTELRHLGILESPLRSLNEISGLTKLEALELCDSSELDSLEGIENFPYLNFLGIANTSIKDISNIEELNLLAIMDITNVDIEDYTPLVNCSSLDTLFVDEGKEEIIKDLNINVRLIIN